MDIDPKKYKQLIADVIAGFKHLETELLAHRMVFETFVRSQYSNAELSLETARNSAPVQKLMREKYDVFLEKLLKQPDEPNPDPDLLEWFRKWKPSGPVN